MSVPTDPEAHVRAVLAGLGDSDVYEIVPCDPDLADTAAFCAAYGFAPEDSANIPTPAGRPAGSTTPKG